MRVVILAVIFQCVAVASAFGQAPPRPLVFIPGLLGSRLADQQGKLIWGGRDSYVNFHKLKLPRDDSAIKHRPDGAIKNIPIVWPLKVKQYDGLLTTLNSLGYEEGETLFVFAYDWRRSNFKTAELLRDFVQNTPVLNNTKFDIIAHSMGGIVATIYVHEHDTNARVQNLITMGTPFLGSLEAFDAFLNGFDRVSGFMARIGSSADDVRSVMFSFESGYEVLPSYSKCCVMGTRGDPNRADTEIFDLGFWLDEWLPRDFANNQDKRFISESLARGKQVAELVRQPFPTYLNLYMYAGDNIATKTQMYLDPLGVIDAFVAKGGDGTVYLQSAARGQVPKSRVSFEKHARIFDDNSFRTGLSRILQPGGLTNFASQAQGLNVIVKDGSVVNVDLVSFEVSPAIVTLGEPLKIVLELEGSQIAGSTEVFEFEVCAMAPATAEERLCLQLVEVETGMANRRFRADYLPRFVGEYTIAVSDYGQLEEYFAVVGRD